VTCLPILVDHELRVDAVFAVVPQLATDAVVAAEELETAVRRLVELAPARDSSFS